MNLRKIFTTLLAGASLFAFAGMASAAVSGDINIYGASAQFIFWRGEAAPFLTAQGCTGVVSATTTDGKHAISKGTCSGVTRYFRSSAKASYDGPLAIQGNTTNPNRTTACADAHQRQMIDETTCTWGGNCTSSAKCVTVTGGSSDVQTTSFNQESHGQLKGPNGGGYVNRNFKGAGSMTETGLTNCRNVVVPFAFFANNSVKYSDGTTTIDNLTTADARLIFSGQVIDWSDLVGFQPRAINVCWRHAGSGTAAALDYAVMRPAVLNINEDLTGPYHYYFNDGASDLMACVNGLSGAVGYADADQSLTSYPNSVRLKYNEMEPTKANIIAGAYDFWTIQNLYTATPRSTDMTNVCNYVSDKTKITNPYYAAQCELNYVRSNDSSYMTYRGTTCP